MNKCKDCEKQGSLRDLFYVDWYGNTVMLNEEEYYCDDCWYWYCLNSD